MNRLNDILNAGYPEDPNALWQANPVPSQVEKKTFKVGNQEYVVAPPGYKEPSMLELGEFVARGIGRTWLEKQKERWEYMKSPLDENPMTKEQIFEAAMNWAPMGMGQIKAFHGSPHKFDKFKMEKIGTGEGAQAFGYGLYFTSEKDIAKHYANLGKVDIAVEDQIFKNLDNRISAKLDVITKRIEENPNAPFDAKLDKEMWDLYYLKQRFDPSKVTEKAQFPIFLREHYGDDLSKALEKFGKDYNIPTDDLMKIVDNRNIYSVTLHKGKQPGEYDYLKWDELASMEQVEKIRLQAKKEGWWDAQGTNFKIATGKEHLKTLLYNPEKYMGGKTNANVYAHLGDLLGSDREASAFLLRAGIDGIEYPAGSLSGKTGKGRNYVVFDENAITIEK